MSPSGLNSALDFEATGSRLRDLGGRPNVPSGASSARRERRGRDRPSGLPGLAMRYHFPRVLAPLRADARFGGIMERVHEFWGMEPDGSFPEGE